MIKAIESLLLLMIIFGSQLYSQEKLEVDGAIIIKSSTDLSPTPGTIRWTGTDFQGWNGKNWISLTKGTAYSGEISDIDGNIYPTINIGGREWMVENLGTSRYRDGTLIPQVIDSLTWINVNYGAWCWYSNNNSYDLPYGKLYNWYAVNDNRGLCPTGWHIPTDTEWSSIIGFLGGTSIAGGTMKEAGTAHWLSPNTGGTNTSGFTGLPGGKIVNTFFEELTVEGYWWSSTESGANAYYRYMYYESSNIFQGLAGKTNGYSVRCIKE